VTRVEPRVAIDGPAGAGKSTVSRLVAERLGYLLLDTGALYRSIALAARNAGLSWEDVEGVSKLALETANRGGVRFEAGAGAPRVLLDGSDVSALIRTQEISQGASKVSAMPGVRAALLELQRSSAARGGVVLEGRDIGTVVLPDAEAKFFLTASVAVRAGRRYRELAAKGENPDAEAVRREVEERDARDSQRAVAPLKQAPDALLVDTSELPVDAVVQRIVDRVNEVRARLAGGRAP
jgi:cytidylate kinase